MKKRLLGLVAIPLIAIGSLTYANDLIVPDAENGTITIYTGDFSYGITIQDKNLGAENVGDYGDFYQWGNNNGNPGDSTISTDLLVWNSGYDNKGYTGTNNGFITLWNGSSYTNMNYDIWSDNELHDNLWGGGNDNDDIDGIVKGYDTVNHVVINPDNRQGPCPDGYHVPSAGEWQELMMLWCNANSGTCDSSTIQTQNGENAWANYLSKSGIGTAFSNDLQIPLAGDRGYYDGTAGGQGLYANYWSSSPRGGSSPKIAWRLRFGPNNVNPSYTSSRALGQSVRCFKNSYVKLPKTLNLFFMSDDEEVGTGEVTENMTGAVPASAESVTKTGYELLGWIRSGATTTEIFEFATTPISGDWADENNNVYFIAQWTGIKYEIKFEAGDGTGTMENQTFIYDVAQNLTANAFTRDGYTFSGWTDGTTGYTDGQEVIKLTTTSGDVITLTAEWTKIETKPSGGYSGGGGGRSSKTSSDSEKSSEGQTGSQQPLSPQQTEQASTAEPHPNPLLLGEGDLEEVGEVYTQEFQQAYEFAKEKWITTMPTIQKANMNGKLTRIAMAKMLSYYAINVLGQKPANIIVPKFNDVTDKQNSDYDDGVTLAYQLGIMGQNMKNNRFRPNDLVTRAEFATALSRMLYSTPDGKPYYTTHLAKLKAEGILTNDDYKMKELRGYVMIMLMRSAK